MMIEAIERKALIEIDALKKDKIQLLRRLNEEIRLHNEEKKLRMMLEEKLRSMGVQQHTTEPLNQNIPTNTEGHDEERRKIAMLLD